MPKFNLSMTASRLKKDGVQSILVREKSGDNMRFNMEKEVFFGVLVTLIRTYPWFFNELKAVLDEYSGEKEKEDGDKR